MSQTSLNSCIQTPYLDFIKLERFISKRLATTLFLRSSVLTVNVTNFYTYSVTFYRNARGMKAKAPTCSTLL